MRFLILSQYYLPETGAPQSRLSSLAVNLIRNGHKVEVLTAMPNYPIGKIYPGYEKKLFSKEKIDDITIHRTWIYASKRKGVFYRLLNYFSFVLTSTIKGISLSSFDYIYCESPPLFLSFSAYTIAWFKKSRVVFNVSDLWPESVKKLNIVNNKTFLKLAYKLEEQSYKKSYLVTGQTQGIINNVQLRYPMVKTHWFPNGIDIDKFRNIVPDKDFHSRYDLHEKKIFMYSGIIGYAQGLEVIIKAAKKLKNNEEIQFVIVGDGPLKNELENLNNCLKANVVFISHTKREVLLNWISMCYAFIVPLKNIDLFKGAIPSKIFEPLALSVPIVLGARGESYDLFIKNQQCGVGFIPEDENDLARVVTNLSLDKKNRDKLGETGKRYVYEYFNRKELTKSFLHSLNNG